MERDKSKPGKGEAHAELVHQIWAQSDQRFLCKYARGLFGQSEWAGNGGILVELDQKLFSVGPRHNL